ncbi:hypothetical protein SAMN04487947_1504 [Halogeometricum rufum]|uniref:Uncharacterized protein n=1 Tax=Halogeometricum rufum TaxID=553469 RepID=A0A1I6GQ69_9EURY|nr:hypothetical protein SAMN04487947_1504 [Halogeometricum rufum]
MYRACETPVWGLIPENEERRTKVLRIGLTNTLVLTQERSHESITHYKEQST